MLLAMAREVSLASLREEQLARRTAILVWIQSLVILALLVWISQDYNNNQYFQAWASQNLGGLGLLLNGSGAAFFAGLLVAIFVFRTLPGIIAERSRGKRQRTVRQRQQREETVLVSPETQ
jgi:TRAP-type C4-dicarboxylate transport system permease small subunit